MIPQMEITQKGMNSFPLPTSQYISNHKPRVGYKMLELPDLFRAVTGIPSATEAEVIPLFFSLLVMNLNFSWAHDQQE